MEQTVHTDIQSSERIQQLLPAFEALLAQEEISVTHSEPLLQRYLDIADWLIHNAPKHAPYFIGINGAQGSGKSTLASILQLILQQGMQQRVLKLSIDDLYYGKAQRQKLADQIHPLLATRGVPGTHDIELGIALFSKLKRASGQIQLPAFDKAHDDRLPIAQWQTVTLPLDIVILEGWCVGAQPQSQHQLQQPLNCLEVNEDPDGTWRQYVNQQLAGPYSRLFSRLDRLIMLQIPDFSKVFAWRGLQEQKLQARQPDAACMSPTELKRFIMHYERITRHTLNHPPSQVDLLLKLDEQHQIRDIIERLRR